LSKLSQLKQKAYQAGKDRDWDRAIAVYEKILEVEKSNPTVINELGDLWLKSGDTRKAVKNFLSAATKYRKTGLLNNSVAICKKILRHDDSNLHAHWYLAEIRSSQDLVVEGESHAIVFLTGGEHAGGEIQEIFSKRCSKLLELYPASLAIMDRLILVFRSMEKPLEAGRAGCLKACVIYDSGDKDGAQKIVDEILVTSPELRNYAEFGKWNKLVNPDAVDSTPMADYNSVALGDPGATPDTPTTAAEDSGTVDSSGGETSFSDISIDVPEVKDADAVPEPVETVQTFGTPESEEEPGVDDMDDEGCLVIDDDGDSDMAALIAQASKEVEAEEPAAEDPVAEEPVAEEQVDLLAQILSEDSESALGDDANQLDTIAAEIGSMVGGNEADDDADRLYEMGLVYLEMGLFDKACESFETAAADDDFTIRAHEMWGVTLQRAERPDEAITVLTSGLQFAEQDSRENLGLRYHIARAHELADRPDTSIGIYEEILAVAPNFLDITARLGQLTRV
jgi:tetratricopeptide (TPR) repeat protein